MPRVLAIGDIHGCSRAFDTLLAEVAPGADDLVITLGDYVDRGPDSCGVIERLLGLSQSTQLVAIRGNHEWMMLQAFHHPEEESEWLRTVGKETIASYAAALCVHKLNEIPSRHWDFLSKTCVPCYETATHLFVHANVDPNLPLAEQREEMLLWQKLVDTKPHVSGKVMVCGHTPQRSGKPLSLDHAICLDTWAYDQGWLTCLDVDNRLYWQANQRGQSRMANLDRLSRR